MGIFDYQNANDDFIVGPGTDNISEELGLVTIVIDRSGSEDEEDSGIRRIDSINEAVPALVDGMSADDTINGNTRLSIIQFNHTVDIIQNWDKPSNAEVPSFTAAGGTDLESALSTAVELGRDFAHDIERVGGRTKVHNIVLVSDLFGYVSDETVSLLKKRDATNRTYLWVFGVPGYNKEIAKSLMPNPGRLFTTMGSFDEGIKQFMSMILKITKAISMSAPGERPQLAENPLARPDNVLAVPDLNKLI